MQRDKTSPRPSSHRAKSIWTSLLKVSAYVLFRLCRFRWWYCDFTIFRFVDMSTDERHHIRWALNAGEPGVERQLRDTRRGLNLCFEDVRLQRIEETLVQQIGRHLIRHRTCSFDEHLICDP